MITIVRRRLDKSGATFRHRHDLGRPQAVALLGAAHRGRRTICRHHANKLHT